MSPRKRDCRRRSPVPSFPRRIQLGGMSKLLSHCSALPGDISSSSPSRPAPSRPSCHSCNHRQQAFHFESFFHWSLHVELFASRAFLRSLSGFRIVYNNNTSSAVAGKVTIEKGIEPISFSVVTLTGLVHYRLPFVGQKRLSVLSEKYTRQEFSLC